MPRKAPNHALQRTGARVTPAASCLRLSPAAQRSRHARPSLSLGSLGRLRTSFLKLTDSESTPKLAP